MPLPRDAAPTAGSDHGPGQWTVPDRGRSAPLRALARRFGAP
ncbi:hypothetical protein RVN83_02545 [Streptomyces sp. PU10]|jgi:hypothetical protein|nr:MULTISPECIES: hypothetical protein [Streptomyces]MDU0252187.1 hypothetical protein [Streptomyces sp. PU10]WSU05446.1 hypothetical protein OG368_34480 [Streptomyces sp. NBC_01124]